MSYFNGDINGYGYQQFHHGTSDFFFKKKLVIRRRLLIKSDRKCD